MKYFLPLLLLILSAPGLNCQTIITLPDEGTITYITPQNVYVKFTTTENITPGDTLYIKQDDKRIPVLKVTDRSSISCVCIPISPIKLNISDKVFQRMKQVETPKKEEVLQKPASQSPYLQKDSVTDVKLDQKKITQKIHGYLSIASYSNFSSQTSNDQRMRYTFSFDGRNLGSTRLSLECYLSFVHDSKNWSEIQNNFYNGLKVYNLALNYTFNNNSTLLFGRKINPKLSNMGASDGLQFDMKFKPVGFGIIAGFRPDYRDYSFNANLFQAGGYIYQDNNTQNGYIQTTFAFIEQTNSWKTDRRYLYLQHGNSVVKNLTFFGSVEVDLYKKVFDSTYTSDTSHYKPVNSPTLSNLYLSLSYRLLKKLFFSISYSNRQTLIFYESYKSYLDKLLDMDRMQGYQFQVTYRPINLLSIGITTAYRFQKQDPKPTKNLYGYITYSQIPGIKVSTTGSFTILEAAYISGKIYSLGISKDFFSGKLYTGLTYRYVDYRFHTFLAEAPMAQNLGEFNLTWRIYKRIFCSLYYEGTFEKVNQYNRIYAQLSVGF